MNGASLNCCRILSVIAGLAPITQILAGSEAPYLATTCRVPKRDDSSLAVARLETPQAGAEVAVSLGDWVK